MPFYDYACPEHGGFTVMRSMAERNTPCACPRCDFPSDRVLCEPPMRGLLTAIQRAAHEAHERSRHEPRSLGAYQSTHGAGCRCCAPNGTRRRSSTVVRPDGMKTLAGRRPWQISH